VASGKGFLGKTVAQVKNAVNARRVGKLFQVTVDAVTEQNKTQLEQSMVSHGIEPSKAKQLADTIVGYMCGDDLTAAQLNTLAGLSADLQVQAAMQDTFVSKDSTAYQLAEKADKIAQGMGISAPEAAANALNAASTDPAESAGPSLGTEQPTSNSVAATPQALLSQAETLLGAENLSAQERNLLTTYREHLSKIQALEQQLQTLQDNGAAPSSTSGTQNANRFAARRNELLLSGVKAQLADTNNTLRQVTDRPQFAGFLQKLQAAEATAKNNSQIQTNVLDSFGNSAIMTVDANTSFEAEYEGREIITDGSHIYRGKLKPNVVYRTGEHGYLYETDDQGRIKRVCTDNLQLKKHLKRLRHISKTLGKRVGDEAGHLLADWFGGSPKRDNLVSQARLVNRKVFGDLEKRWAQAIADGKQVKVDIQLTYEGDDPRPTGFTVKYIVSKNDDTDSPQRAISRTFDNTNDIDIS